MTRWSKAYAKQHGEVATRKEVEHMAEDADAYRKMVRG